MTSASNTNAASGEREALLRALPSVHTVIELVLGTDACAPGDSDGVPGGTEGEAPGDWDSSSRALVTDAARAVLDEYRAALLAGSIAAVPSAEQIAAKTRRAVARAERPLLPAVVNATGILLHTGLGRAPLARQAVDAIARSAMGYAPVELDLDGGGRGRRAELVEPLLCTLTGAEAATVVNNNAAALLLAIETIGRDREVIVSRGELIEIGGSFRLPDIMREGGVRLREVGTTNRTRLSDYEEAINERTAAILKVHTSNYRIEGFAASVPIDELAALGHRHGLCVIDDVGSGALRRIGVADANEPIVPESIAAGADLVLFSGDKLLGGPQGGIIVGRAEYVRRLERSPLMRAMRVGRLTLAALGATLQLHRDADRARQELPVMRLRETPVAQLEDRARSLAARLSALPGIAHCEVEPSVAFVGGGALPAEGVQSVAIVVQARDQSESSVAAALREGTPPVVVRTHGGAVRIEMRSVFPEQDQLLEDAFARCLG